MRKHKKKVWYVLQQKQEAERAVTDIKFNYLQEGWDVEIYQGKKQTYIEPSTIKKASGNNITEDPPRITKSHRVMKEKPV